MSNELYHYGVPGMKWGKRKSKIEKISSRSKKRGWSDDATETAKIKTKKLNQMSNNELRKINDRKQLERNYKQLNPNVVKKGLAFVGATAAAMGTITLLQKNSAALMKIGKSESKKIISKINNSIKIDLRNLR